MSNYAYIDDLFLLRFPGGLDDEEFNELGKKHRSSDKILDTIKNDVDLNSFILEDDYHINKNIETITKLVTKSSMISVFEKVTFKKYIADKKIQATFLKALYEMLTNLNENTMSEFVGVLNLKNAELNKRVATWPLVTFFLVYFNDNNEIFIKPSTIKKLGKLLEYDIKYESIPNYMTYTNIKKMIMDYKKQSILVKNESNLMVQAIMYCALEL